MERLEQAADQHELIGSFRACVEPFGFNIVLITGLPDPPADLKSFLLLNSWPAGWRDHYFKEGFYRDDPVAAYGRVRSDPFAWHEAPVDPARQPRAAQVMAEAADAGMRDGLVIPIMASKTIQTCVSVAGVKPDLHPNVQRMIHLLGLFAHTRAVRLHLGPIRSSGQRLLSEREREVLQWTAAGKTAWETSCILGISERTVNYHITTAARRLQAVSRTHAVARAIALGEITVS
ncbi:LuxR family transcriptional regulator [Blastochloris viridis]|uniref:Transcriptional activator protein lasR n=1 Tax=Blastochloris viridis TaxID=1079 RepID=A0A0H5BQE4_BLAVI|nr:LuxR family transcriptional regulator [Blastochloris viridis]ALK09318.1 Transcriptional activator protein LasR [Blastochloris viridis]BAS00804.1 transcriptional regulator [Blastochloris viridis]CUU41981.1 Transcriptional activator protein lasR [Blastochloris viridis]